jgi:S-adenosylmethionine hydrolase
MAPTGWAQTARYWPPGTVFVAVIDPGVGTGASPWS